MLYSGLLIRAYAETHRDLLPLGDVPVRRELLPLAIQCLMSLDKDNRMTEKCARYTLKLDRVLAMLGESFATVSSLTQGRSTDSDIQPVDSTQPMGDSGVPVQAGQQSHAAGPASNTSTSTGPGLFDHGNTPLGLDWSEFMVPGDLDFLKTFDVNTFAL